MIRPSRSAAAKRPRSPRSTRRGSRPISPTSPRAGRGPRAYDASGLPLHEDNESIFKERIFLDKQDRDLLHDEITTIDHALTRPWTVTKNYRRNPYPQAEWREWICGENNSHVVIGGD